MEFCCPKTIEFATVFPLWQEAFGDSEDTVRQYLSAIRPHARLFLCTEENTPLSMLFAVEEQVLGHKIAYIYAVATKKSHQGQGLGAKLLFFAEEQLKKDFAACILCPAEPSLTAYYARLGYAPWSAAGIDAGNENVVPDAIRKLHHSPEIVFAMAKIFNPSFPKTGTFRYHMG